MTRKYDEDLFESTKMTFGEHLEELRLALFRSLVAIVIGFLIGLTVSGRVVEFIQRPMLESLDQHYLELEREELRRRIAAARSETSPPTDFDEVAAIVSEDRLVLEKRFIDPWQLWQQIAEHFPGVLGETQLPDRPAVLRKRDLISVDMYHSLDDDRRVRMVSLSAQEPFFVYVKAALLVGAVLASPFVFYYIWNFIAAGLYPHERHYVHLFLPISLGLFLAGAALAFFVVFEFVLAFLLAFNTWMGIDPDPRISEWLSFVVLLPLGFGISFQLPLVMFFLERIGVFSTADYLSKWRIAVLAIFVLSMLLTPSDPGSMILMALPLTVLYFGGIAMCRLLPQRRDPYGEPIDA